MFAFRGDHEGKRKSNIRRITKIIEIMRKYLNENYDEWNDDLLGNDPVNNGILG
jgi:hypothetical protein